MDRYKAILSPGEYFHVCNRAVGNDKLFINDEDYLYFLKLFIKYITPVADVFSYSLLPNHFHLFLRFFERKQVFARMEQLEYAHNNEEAIPKFLLQQFSNFFNAYVKVFNYKQDRKGKLFMEPFCRKSIDTMQYYTKIIHYVHVNVLHHGVCKTLEQWPYSSYLPIIKGNVPWLKSDEVIKWFGNVEEFIRFHHQPVLVRSSKNPHIISI
jgi:putative transposase